MVMKAAVSAMVLLGVASAPVLAQGSGANALEQGRRSFAFTLPDGGGASFGIWTMLSDRTNLGLDAGIRLTSDDDDNSAWDVALTPAIKRYVRSAGPIAPFLYASVSGGIGRTSQGPADQNRWNLGAFGGLGVEWFPVRSVSIGGYTGLGLNYSSSELESPGLPAQTSSELTLSTATSALSIQIYFGGAGPRGGQVADGR